MILILLAQLVGVAPENGVDAGWQQAAQRAVARRGETEVGLLALDPSTGEILAVVNESLMLRQAFPPGSVMKLIVATAALESSKAGPEWTIRCDGSTELLGRSLRCWLPHGHGTVTMTRALALSCNIYFAHLSVHIGSEAILRWSRMLAFGRGVPRPGFGRGSVSPGVAAGDVPSLGLGLSDAVLVTPLELARAVLLLSPAQYTSRSSPVIQGIHRPSLQASRWVVLDGMAQAVEDGTASGLSNLGVSVAAKTGTAGWIGGFRTHGWTVGFAPRDRPEVIFCAFVRAGEGRKDAVPLAADFLRAAAPLFSQAP